MKVLTILGTRPEIIRLSQIIPKLDEHCTQYLLHTGQNFDHEMDKIFFDQFGLRKPDNRLEARGSFAQQVATILVGVEEAIKEFKPDRFLVLGDTNSSVGAFVAARMGVPVFHMEAGNRCFDNRVPEEVNRRLIDHVSDVLMPYTERARQNLLDEGIPNSRIFVIGNPIHEVLEEAHRNPEYPDKRTFPTFDSKISKVISDSFFLVTLHRQENVDDRSRLKKFFCTFGELCHEYGVPIIVSAHPRLRIRLKDFKIKVPKKVILCKPFSFYQFVELEQRANCILTDSGTVQEECAIMDRPVVTLRDSTERQETLERGTNILAGCDPAIILKAVAIIQDRAEGNSDPMPEYTRDRVSEAVTNIVLGYYMK